MLGRARAERYVVTRERPALRCVVVTVSMRGGGESESGARAPARFRSACRAIVWEGELRGVRPNDRLRPAGCGAARKGKLREEEQCGTDGK